MIAARSPFAGLAARLAGKAEALARAQSQAAALKRGGDSRHWRSARLVWPLFGQG